MKADLSDLNSFVAVAEAKGFREASRVTGISASGLSEAIRRLETRLGVRLLNRTTRSVVPTEAGQGLLNRLGPALAEMEAALDVVNTFRDTPAGLLRLNVPISAARLVLPKIFPAFLARYPEIRLEIVGEGPFVDVIEAGFDAGIRYEERLQQDMIAVPIGPRRQRFATAASPEYLKARGVPKHPKDLLDHICLRIKTASGVAPWTYERKGEVITVDPSSQALIYNSAASDLAVQSAIAGAGVMALFESWLQPHFDEGTLVPVLQPWWQEFSGPMLYYPSRKLVPAPLRAFIDFIKDMPAQ